MNFLDVRTDYAFKKVFGSENFREILISFLNALISDSDGDKKILDFKVLNLFNYGVEYSRS